MCCLVLSVSRSGYYKYKRLKEQRQQKKKQEDRIKLQLRVLWKEHKGRYGHRRLFNSLPGETKTMVSPKQVLRFMKEEHLTFQHKRKWIPTTKSNPFDPVAPNVLQRNFHEIESPNLVWLADVTYLWTIEGWLFLAAVLDACTRELIGWSMQPHMKTSLVLDALQMAIENRKWLPSFRKRSNPLFFDPSTSSLSDYLLFHSDRGSQYTSSAFQQALQDNWIMPSMSRKGNCWDNAPMESFFHTLKQEMVYSIQSPTRKIMKQEVFRYIEGYYNTKRLHSSLGYMTPQKYAEWIIVENSKKNQLGVL